MWDFPAKQTGITVCWRKLCAGVLLLQCPSVPGCCVPVLGSSCALLLAVWQPAPAAKLSGSLLCWLEHSVCLAVGMEAVSRGVAVRWDNAPYCSRESLLGCLGTRQVQLLPKSPLGWVLPMHQGHKVLFFAMEGHLYVLTRRNELHLFLGNPVPNVAFIL